MGKDELKAMRESLKWQRRAVIAAWLGVIASIIIGVFNSIKTNKIQIDIDDLKSKKADIQDLKAGKINADTIKTGDLKETKDSTW